MRRRAIVAAVLALVGVLASCARVPTSGPVRFEPMGTSSPGRTSIPVLVSGPDPGDSAQQVARGFLDSMASYQAGQPISRKYLAPSVAERWQPSGVFVYDSAVWPLSEPEPGRVLIDVPLVAHVGPGGAWTSAHPGERVKLDLGMTKVDGEWRISNPPDALIMSTFNFNREFAQHNLYFFDPNFEILVPDPVYLPIRGHLETLLVNALLRGPSPWLRPAVQSALPAGTRLATPAVTVEDSVARIDLTGDIANLSDSQRRFILAQLAWTLGQVPGVRKVEVTSDRVSLGVEDAGVRPESEKWPIYDPMVAGAARGAYALSKGRLVILGPDRTVPVRGPLGQVDLDARSIAVSLFAERDVAQPREGDKPASAHWLATVSSDGTTVRVHSSAGETRTVLQGTDIVEPSWDRTGQLWMTDRRGGRARILVRDLSERLFQVAAPGLTGKDVRALKVSREGARVAALVEESGRTNLYVGRIERGDAMNAIRGLRQIRVPLTSMTDLAWADLDRIVVLGREGESPARPTLVSVDGSQVEFLGSGPNAHALAAAPGQPVLLAAEDGRLYVEHSDYRWAVRGEGTCPAYPG
ncbi:LpqB family beta-propeller domain-containing protein [Thermasporomyces composti]|jgi:hypothetical protein|uniref:Sporulation and spore germination protein n=1 Tax=Thermasporomyces composti TaxID=696763 RepID=A0A3D9VBH9_THECX|nr:LpqB family beta-propeller domain-containing protein [Thermasporomyces composti]REF37540.1 sporulation and spore germination protein [Thermasporomyces composti]